MREFVKSALTSGAEISSARAINVFGAIIASALLVWDTLANGTVRSETFGMYLAYCAGVYGYGKKLDKDNK